MTENSVGPVREFLTDEQLLGVFSALRGWASPASREALNYVSKLRNSGSNLNEVDIGHIRQLGQEILDQSSLSSRDFQALIELANVTHSYDSELSLWLRSETFSRFANLSEENPVTVGDKLSILAEIFRRERDYKEEERVTDLKNLQQIAQALLSKLDEKDDVLAKPIRNASLAILTNAGMNI